MSLSSISRGLRSSPFTIVILIANSEWIKTIIKIEYHHIYLVHRRAKGSFWSVGVLKLFMLQSLGVGFSLSHQRHRNHHLSQSRTKRRMRRVPNWHRLCVSPSPVSTMPSPPPPSPSTSPSSSSSRRHYLCWHHHHRGIILG